MKKDYTKLSIYLKAARIKAGLTQAEVSDKIGYTGPQFVSNFERGICAPSTNSLLTLVDLYNLDSNKFLRILVSTHKDHVKRILEVG